MEKHKLRYEARHAAPREAKYSVTQKLTAVAMALTSAASVGAGLHQRNEDMRAKYVAVAEKYIGANVDTLTASVDPEYTIILPYEMKRGGLIDESWDVPEEERLKAQGRWCDAPDVPLYTYANPEQMEAASKIEMGLSVSAYEAISNEIIGASDRAEVEAIVEGVYGKIGVKATFNETRDDFVAKDDPRRIENGDSEGLRKFTNGMIEHLEALTYMPMPMAKLPKSIDFVDADKLYQVKVVNGKKQLEGFDGMYLPRNDKVILRVGSEAWVTVHEYAHASQQDACPGAFRTEGTTDGELEQVHAKARDLAVSSKEANEIKQHWPLNSDGWEERYFADYRWRTGFPTNYSLSDQAEFFADAATALLMKGQLNVYDTKHTPEQIAVLQQMVVERLTDAMSGVDVRSLVAARTEARVQARGEDVPLQALITNRVSSYDMTFASSYGHVISGDRVEPALKIMNPDGKSGTYIFCKKSDLRMTPEGPLGGEYSIKLADSGDQVFDKTLQDTALKYLMEIGKDKQIQLEYEIRTDGDSTYIFATIPERPLTDTKPKIRYVDLTKNKVGTGG